MHDSTDRARQQRQARLGRAIRNHRGRLTQAELARGIGISQASVSSWESGGVDLTVEQVFSIEAALGLSAGALLAEAGYVSLRPGSPAETLLLALRTLEDAVERLVAVADGGPRSKGRSQR